MKKIIKTVIMLLPFALVSTVMFAQQTGAVSSTPKWISDKGFWIIENNIKTPDTSIIHFYNNDNIEVYSEKVEGIIINLKKRKTLMRLKKALDQSLFVWKQSQVKKDSVQLVRNIFTNR